MARRRRKREMLFKLEGGKERVKEKGEGEREEDTHLGR